jgi:hypothetical protein
MSAEKEFAGVFRKMFEGGFDDANFGAAGVGDERVGRGEASDFWQEI